MYNCFAILHYKLNNLNDIQRLCLAYNIFHQYGIHYLHKVNNYYPALNIFQCNSSDTKLLYSNCSFCSLNHKLSKVTHLCTIRLKCKQYRYSYYINIIHSHMQCNYLNLLLCIFYMYYYIVGSYNHLYNTHSQYHKQCSTLNSHRIL